jgi:hypothetical protein
MSDPSAIGAPLPVLRDRQGNVLAAGQFIGPGSEGDRFILLFCHACETEQVVGLWIPTRVSRAWRTWIERDGERVTVHGGQFERIERVVTTCLACGRSLNVRMCGRLFEPWPFGAGVIVPMSDAWRELHDGEVRP